MRKRKRAFGSDEQRAAHDALVDEHLRRAYELVDAGFAERGETRPADTVAYVREYVERRFPAPPAPGDPSR